VRKALERLVAQGIVIARAPSHAVLYRLNREHLAADAIITIAQLGDTFHRRLAERIVSWPLQPPYAALFGSAAEGRMRPESDIDLFLVRPAGVEVDHPEWRAQLDRLRADAVRWTGNDVRILDFGVGEVRAGRQRRDPVLDDIARHGIVLHGPASYLRKRA